MGALSRGIVTEGISSRGPHEIWRWDRGHSMGRSLEIASWR